MFVENFRNNGLILSNPPSVKKHVKDPLSGAILLKDLMTFQSYIQLCNLIFVNIFKWYRW